MKIAMFATFALAWGAAALVQAQEPGSLEPMPVLMTYCIPGESCTTCESEMPMDQVNKLLEINLSDVEVLLFKPDPKRPDSHNWQWFETGEIFSAVVEHKNSGVGSRANPPQCRDRAPLKGSQQPRDGVWVVSPSGIVPENCSVEGTPAPEATRETLRFDKPFHGRMSPAQSYATVVQVSPNAFASREESQGRVGETLLQVLSPDRMKMFVSNRSADPADPCVFRYSIDLTRDANG